MINYLSQAEKYGIKAVSFVLSASVLLGKMPSFMSSKVENTANTTSMFYMHLVAENVENLSLVSHMNGISFIHNLFHFKQDE